MQEVNKPSYKKIILRVLVLVVYLSIGGALFQLFEKSYHVAANKKYRQMLKSFRDRYNISEKDMNDLEMTIIQDGKHSMNNDWNLSNAIFFAGTTVLTVGYGNIVPKTTAGRVFCIAYAFLGIPIACLALKSIAERIMVMEVLLIKKTCRYIWGNQRVRSVHFKASILNFVLTVLAILLLAGMAKLKRKEWSYFECIYFSFITFTTIGFGDYIPTYNNSFSEYDVLTLILGFFIGFSMVSCLLCSLSYAMEEHSRTVIRKAKTTMEHQKTRKARSQTLQSLEMETIITTNDCAVNFSDENGKKTRVTLQKYSDFNGDERQANF